MNTTTVDGKQWLGHPRGLATLFFTEMWERFSYYGMRGILLLFLVASVQNGGFGMTDRTGAAIYGLYVGFVYLMALPGGWVADRILGQRRAVFIGGCFIAAGHFSMAIGTVATFYLGLCLIVIGTGLLKPNASTLVGSLYEQGDKRRDAGFSIFYMGINLGAFIGPLVAGWLAQKVDWHLGFAAAGFGMAAGIAMLREIDRRPPYADLERKGALLEAAIREAVRERGVFLPPAQFEAWFVSTAHTDADLRRTARAVGEALGEISGISDGPPRV